MVVGETPERREIRESMKIVRSLALEGKGPPTRPTFSPEFLVRSLFYVGGSG